MVVSAILFIKINYRIFYIIYKALTCSLVELVHVIQEVERFCFVTKRPGKAFVVGMAVLFSASRHGNTCFELPIGFPVVCDKSYNFTDSFSSKLVPQGCGDMGLPSVGFTGTPATDAHAYGRLVGGHSREVTSAGGIRS